LTLKEKYSLASYYGNPSSQKGKTKLPEKLHIAIGMKVMVTLNVETDLDITNGARGEVMEIVLDSREPPHEKKEIIELHYLPAYILVKMHRTRATRLEGLQESVLPIIPAAKTVQIKIPGVQGKLHTRSVRQCQFPMTAAYAFTDYRSQGQTIPYVMVDLASPPSGKLSLFNLYVALSRSSGQQTIRLLRPFEDRMFMEPHSPELLQEDDRLADADRQTEEWWAVQKAERESSRAVP